ncbi:unnamed protein product [Calypogeia fissa]
MVGNVVAHAPHLASNPKGPPLTRKVVDSTKENEGVGLADLRDADKAKVARLINHVMVAFKEIQRLKELLELERTTQEALVAKLQQQNHEVATERVNSCYMSSVILNHNLYAQLRLKLASLQLMSPLPSQKVYLNTAKRPSLSPIREAESSEAESKGTQGLVPEGVEEMQSILKERENQSCGITTSAERNHKGIFDKSNGTEHCIGNAQMGQFQASNSQANVSKTRGKENKDPEVLPEMIRDPHMTSEEDAGMLRKRPPPRPLPDLLSNILHRCRDVGLADYSESSIKFVSEGDPLTGSGPILQGKVKSTAPKPPQEAAQATRSCFSMALDSINELNVDAAPISQGLHEVSTGLYGEQCPSSNLANTPCPELLGASEKERNGTSNHEDLIEPKLFTSQMKLRFDPTAGEEGTFYYESDVKQNVKPSIEMGSLQPILLGERQGVQVGEKAEQAERVFSTMPSMEGQRLERDPLESHWTPEAIERRNSFHKIPVVSPRSMNHDERQADEHTRLSSDSKSTKITGHENERGGPCSEEQVRQPTSESEVLSLRNEKESCHKSRPSLQRTVQCVNCSSAVSLRSRKASQSSKPFAKPTRRCLKCSSIVESTSSMHRYQENDKRRERMTRREKCSLKGKPSSKEFGSVNEETPGCETEENFSASDPSTPSRSQCRKCTTPKSRLFKPVQQGQRRGQVGMSGCVPADEERSNPASVVYCAASEDMYTSTHSSTDYSTKTRGHVPSSPLTVCRIHTRKVRKKHGNRHEMKSVKLHSAQGLEPTKEVFDVNRAILDMLRQSDGKHEGQLKAPRGDSTECWIETWRFGKPHKSSCQESADEETSRTSSGAFAVHGQLDADLDTRRRSKLGYNGRQRARQHHHKRGRKQTSETRNRFDVDDLLDRFIQSNAEYAAELIKCSVYFESTSSGPSSRSNIKGDESTDCTLSNRPFQNSIAAKHGIGSNMISSPRRRSGRGLFRGDHNEFTPFQPCPEESVHCRKCGGYMKPGTMLPPACAIDRFKTQELRDLCDECSASMTPEKKVVRSFADIGPEKGIQVGIGPPPIILPRLDWDDQLKTHEAVRQQKSKVHSGTSEILICDVNGFRGWTTDALHDHLHLSGEDHRMPIITGVSVNSRRSTPSLEMEEDGTAKELTEMFDMSLYDLVNDLEGQRRDYWRRGNSHGMEEGTKAGQQSNSKRQPVTVDNVHGSYNTRRLAPRKQVHPNRFARDLYW